MLVYLLLLIYLIIMLIITWFDKRLYSTFLTPSICLGWPFLFVCIASLIINRDFNYIQLDHYPILVWILGILIFWLTGIALYSFTQKKIITVDFNGIYEASKNNFSKLMLIIGYVFFFLYLIGWIHIFKKNGFNLEATNDETLGGYVAHLFLLLRFFLIYNLIIIRFHRNYFLNYLLVFLIVLIVILAQSKGFLLVTILAGIMGRYFIYRKRIKIKHLLVGALLGPLTFLIIYSLSFNHIADRNFVGHHFVGYLNAGVLSFQEYLKQDGELGLNFEFLFEPIANVYYKIIDVPRKSIISDLTIMIGDNFISNVKTFFGTTLIYGGIIGGGITCLIISLFYHIVFVIALKIRSLIILTYYFFILSQLFFGWFDIYFNNIAFYEICVFSILLYIAERIAIGNGKIMYIK